MINTAFYVNEGPPGFDDFVLACLPLLRAETELMISRGFGPVPNRLCVRERAIAEGEINSSWHRMFFNELHAVCGGN
jgi:hypothetical protein